MKIECIPLTSFVHGAIDAHEGKAVMIEGSVADELERAGLIRVKRERPAPIVPQASEAGKPPAAGVEQPSSASPAAPVSPETTSPPSDGGAKKRRRRGA